MTKTKRADTVKPKPSAIIEDLENKWSEFNDKFTNKEIIEKFIQDIEERTAVERGLWKIEKSDLPSESDLEFLIQSEPNGLKTPLKPDHEPQKRPKSPFTPPQPINSYINQALKFYNTNELKKAIDCFQIIIDSEPGKLEIQKDLSQIKDRLKEILVEKEIIRKVEMTEVSAEEELAKMMGTSSYTKQHIKRASDNEKENVNVDELPTLYSNPELAEKIIQEMIEKGYFPKDYINIDNDSHENAAVVNDDLNSNILSTKRHGSDNTLGGIINEVNRRLEAEEKLKVLSSAVEQVTEGITISNLDGKLLYVNPAFANMHGYTPDKVVGTSISNFYSGDEQSFMDLASMNGKGGTQSACSTALNGEFWHVKNDGTRFPTFTKSSVFCDDSGNPIGLIGTHSDITKLKRSEIEIRKLGSAVEQSIDGIAVTDLEMRITYVNDAFAAIHGYTPDELIGMHMEDLHNKSQQRALKNRMNQFEETGFWEGELKRIRRDRSKFPSYMSLTLIKDQYGKPMGTLTITRDITERKRMESELTRYTKHLEDEVQQRTNELIQSEKMASLGQLVDGVAHELNNPLEYITLNTELVQERLEDLEPYFKNNEARVILNEINTLLQTNIKGVDRITSTTKALTRFAEPEKMGKKSVDVNQGLKDTLQFFYNQNKHRIIIHEHYGKLPETNCSLGQLNQMFMSIFLNSSQAMEQGDIWVRTRSEIGSIYIEIEDNGTGIPEKIMDKIFDPFFTTRKGATGLGLSLAYRIISAHNGEITVESKLNRGTNIKIKLPLVETYEH